MIGKLRIMNGANKGFQSIGEILAESFSGLSEAWLPELSELLSDGFASPTGGREESPRRVIRGRK